MTQEEMKLTLVRLFKMAVFIHQTAQAIDKFVGGTTRELTESVERLLRLIWRMSDTMRAAAVEFEGAVLTAGAETGVSRRDLLEHLKSFPEQAAKYAEEFDLD